LFYSLIKAVVFQKVVEQKTEWKSRWQSQLSELKRRSSSKDGGGGNMSWAARMRQQRDELSNELPNEYSNES